MSGYLAIDGVAVVGYTSERNEPNGIPAGYQQEIENGRVLNFQRMHGKDPAKQAVRLIAMRLPQNPPITVTASSGSVRSSCTLVDLPHSKFVLLRRLLKEDRPQQPSKLWSQEIFCEIRRSRTWFPLQGRDNGLNTMSREKPAAALPPSTRFAG
jgi:hypothetical protein